MWQGRVSRLQGSILAKAQGSRTPRFQGRRLPRFPSCCILNLTTVPALPRVVLRWSLSTESPISWCSMIRAYCLNWLSKIIEICVIFVHIGRNFRGKGTCPLTVPPFLLVQIISIFFWWNINKSWVHAYLFLRQILFYLYTAYFFLESWLNHVRSPLLLPNPI